MPALGIRDSWKVGSPCHSWKVGSPSRRFQGLQPPKTGCWRFSSLLRFCVAHRRLQGALPTAVDRAEFVLDAAVLTPEERLPFNRSGVTMSHYEVEFQQVRSVASKSYTKASCGAASGERTSELAQTLFCRT